MTRNGMYVRDGDRIVRKHLSYRQIRRLYRDAPQNLYSEVFFETLQKQRVWQMEMGHVIAAKMGVKSVVDFGCGSGYFLEGLLEGGAKTVLGFEYFPENAKSCMSTGISEFIKQGNVMEPILCGLHDLSMSIEVAEHIMPEKSDVFVDNITKASQHYVMLSAAPPGQRGTGHINLQEPSFWFDKFAARGFPYNDNLTVFMRKAFGGMVTFGQLPGFMRTKVYFFSKQDSPDTWKTL